MIATIGFDPRGAVEVLLENTKHYLFMAEGGVKDYLDTAGRVFKFMGEQGISTLHIHHAALGVLGLPEQIKPRQTHAWTGGKPLRASMQSGTLEINIGAYEPGGDPFEDAADGAELLAAHVAFATAFERRWEWRHSAIITGWNLMHAQWRRGRRAQQIKGWDERNEIPKLAGVREGAQIEIPYGSWTPPERRDAGLPYVCAWDVNGQRLAACSRLACGIGGLGHASYVKGSKAAFDKRLPGYHLITGCDEPHAGLIPPLLTPGWHTTPRLAMAEYLGIGFEIKESWVWTEHVPYLDPWYEQLRDAREQLLARLDAPGTDRAAQIALEALKQAYLQPLGRLRSIRARKAGDAYYRPGWYDAVIGQEIAREYLRLHQLAATNHPIVAVYFDTIIVEGPEPADRWHPTALTISSQLGKYKPVGWLTKAEAHRWLYGGIHGEQPGVSALVKALKTRHFEPMISAGAHHPAHGGYPNA